MKPNLYDKYHVTCHGDVYNAITGHLLKPYLNQETGYLFVSLSHDGIVTKHTVHSLVAKIYVPNSNPSINVVIDHIDGNKLNNDASNLEWVTVLENSIRAVELGLTKSGENCSWSLFTNDQVHRICQLLQQGYRNSDIIKMMGFPSDDRHKSLITRIRLGRQWKGISKHYQFDRISTLRKRSDSYVDKICQYICKRLSPKQIASLFGIATKQDLTSFRKLIRNIRMKSCYKNISDKYF